MAEILIFPQNLKNIDTLVWNREKELERYADNPDFRIASEMAMMLWTEVGIHTSADNLRCLKTMQLNLSKRSQYIRNWSTAHEDPLARHRVKEAQRQFNQAQ